MIIHGDCIEVLRKMTPVKAIFGDPPDNLGMKYNGYDDKRHPVDYYNFLHLLILEALPKCKVLWLSYYPTHDLEVSYLVRDIIKYRHPSFESNKFIWRFTFGQYNDHDCGYGYRPIMRLKRSDCVMYPDEIREISQRQMLGDPRAAGEKVPDNVWNIPRVVGNSPERCPWMPTQHAIKLMERIVKFSVMGDEIIVDLFGGSGSLLRAAKINNRRAAVVELDESTCQNMLTLPELKNSPLIKFADGFDWNSTVKQIQVLK